MKNAMRAILVAAALLGAGLAPAIGHDPNQPAGSIEAAPCTCHAAAAANGWCDKHAVGYVASIPIRSRMLFDSLDAHGHDVDPATFDCPVCQKAIRTDGVCEEHVIGFVDKQAYFTRIAYELARAVYIQPEKIECPDCRRNAATSGWCATHRQGMIGGFAMKDETGWRSAARAADVLRIAVKKLEECERCAIAIAYDSDCPVHGIWYKDGAAVPAPPQPPAPPQKPPD